MIVVDTSAILAYMNAADNHHAAVRSWVDGVREDLATTPLVVAEADHLIAREGGPSASRAFRDDLAAGAYIVEWWPGAITVCTEVANRYQDMGLGLTDASLVALAHRAGTRTIATLDDRHFRAVRPLSGGPAFRLVPGDRDT